MHLPLLHYSSFSFLCLLSLASHTAPPLHFDYKVKSQQLDSVVIAVLTRLLLSIGCELKVFFLFDAMSKTPPSLLPLSLQSTSGSAQVGLLPQGVRLLRSPAVPQASSDAFTFSQTTCSLEQNFTVEDVNTPKVSPVVKKKKHVLLFVGVCVAFCLCVCVLPLYDCSTTSAFMFVICLHKYVLRKNPDKTVILYDKRTHLP